MISIMLSSIAISMSSRRRTAPCRARPMPSSRDTVESSLLVISRAFSKSPLESAGCSLLHMLSFLRRIIVSVK
jgi:hypothetical protein